MRSRPDARRIRAGQRGYTLMEVMIASVILSVFVLGMSGFWYSAVGRAYDLVLRQKAVFVLNAEMERISALYVYTNFADCGTFCSSGPVTTNGYDGLASIPSTRFVYPSDVSDYTNSGDYVTTNANTFQSSEFQVYLDSSFFSSNNRTYVWIDKSRNIVGRLSWTTSDVTAGSCGYNDCSCQKFDNSTSNGQRCQMLSVYLEYPYKFSTTGTVTAPASMQTLSLKTIVGRGDA
jgi:prepilin-type N-terminal cleavage/methylation domain-containing protein